MEVAYGEAAVEDGVPVRMWTDGGGKNQRWRFVSIRPAPFRIFRLEACHSFKCLETVTDPGVREQSSRVQQGNYAGRLNQHWYVVSDSLRRPTRWLKLVAAVGTLLVTAPLGVLLLAFPGTAVRAFFPIVFAARFSGVAAAALLALAAASFAMLILDEAVTIGLSIACATGLVVVAAACIASPPHRWLPALIFSVLFVAQIIHGVQVWRAHMVFLTRSRALLWGRLAATAVASGLLVFAGLITRAASSHYPAAEVLALLAGLLMTVALLGWCAIASEQELRWAALSLVIVLAVLVVAALAREENLVASPDYRRALVGGLVAVVLLCLAILVLGSAVPASPPGLLASRIFTLTRLSVGVIALGIGAAWLLSGIKAAVPVAFVVFGFLILLHVGVLRLYGWWSAEGTSEMSTDKQAELRVLGYREAAMLNVATPGIILGFIALLGQSLDTALKVAAPALAFAIILALIVHALVAFGQRDALRSRLLVSYIQTISLYSLVFGLSCVALSLSFRR